MDHELLIPGVRSENARPYARCMKNMKVKFRLS